MGTHAQLPFGRKQSCIGIVMKYFKDHPDTLGKEHTIVMSLPLWNEYSKSLIKKNYTIEQNTPLAKNALANDQNFDW